MKKINNKGFILAETLIVSIFLMVIFSMIYSNFYPLIGEYEKRENYDDVDGKYTAYWIKKIIESDDYTLTSSDISMLNRLGFTRFSCSNIPDAKAAQRNLCINLVKSLEISRCNDYGDGCDIYLTRYTIHNDAFTDLPSLKAVVRGEADHQEKAELNGSHEISAIYGHDPFSTANLVGPTGDASKSLQMCCQAQAKLGNFDSTKLSCKLDDLSQISNSFNAYDTLCTDNGSGATPEQLQEIVKFCHDRLMRKSFLPQTKDYILSLPSYSIPHTSTKAKFRIIVVVHHIKDGNDFYSFSTMEVVR